MKDDIAASGAHPTLAIDASWLGLTGIGRFAQEILRRAPPVLRMTNLRPGKPNASAISPWLLAKAFRTAPPSRAFWSPGFMPPLLPKTVWQAITIHDLTHLRFYGFAHKAYYEVFVRPLIRRMDLVFTVSEFSRQEILSWARLTPDRVVAVHHGLDPAFTDVGDRLDLGRPYILYVGNRRPYKNVTGLLRGFARSGLAGKGLLIALSGEADTATEDLARSLGLTDHIRYLGVIPESQLPATYRGAEAVAFISLYEGFGFPIIEGMGCGVPVLTSATSSMPEVAGGAALLVQDPRNVEQVRHGLIDICTNAALRSRLRREGLERARSFSWDGTARSYWQRILPHC